VSMACGAAAWRPHIMVAFGGWKSMLFAGWPGMGMGKGDRSSSGSSGMGSLGKSVGSGSGASSCRLPQLTLYPGGPRLIWSLGWGGVGLGVGVGVGEGLCVGFLDVLGVGVGDGFLEVLELGVGDGFADLEGEGDGVHGGYSGFFVEEETAEELATLEGVGDHTGVELGTIHEETTSVGVDELATLELVQIGLEETEGYSGYSGSGEGDDAGVGVGSGLGVG
jgi:hypothetical protein